LKKKQTNKQKQKNDFAPLLFICWSSNSIVGLQVFTMVCHITMELQSIA